MFALQPYCWTGSYDSPSSGLLTSLTGPTVLFSDECWSVVSPYLPGRHLQPPSPAPTCSPQGNTWLAAALPRPPLSFMFRGKRPLRINSPGSDKEFSDLKDHPLCCSQQHSAWAAALLSCVPSSSSLPGPAHIHCSFPGLAVSSAGVSLLFVLYYLGLLFEWNRCQILITCDARIHREGQWLI